MAPDAKIDQDCTVAVFPDGQADKPVEHRPKTLPGKRPALSHEHITTAEHLAEFVAHIASAESIAFDTEFVSEDTYHSDLCLIQVFAAGRLAVIDPLAVGDVRPFWDVVSSGNHETIVHAGREEFVFCLAATGRRPTRLFDIQIAAGLIGFEYPAGYGSLSLAAFVGRKAAERGKTRTDWSCRLLSSQQIEYALDDVRFLPEMRNRLYTRLESLGRLHWMTDEMEAWQAGVGTACTADAGGRVSGINGLSSRSLAIVRELWRWRDSEAKRRDSPVRAYAR